MITTVFDVVIVGAGAAGVFFGAQFQAMAPHLAVCLLEASHQPLSKVSISGGGRCNVTHASFDPPTLSTHYPRGGKWLKPLLYHFGPAHMVDWLQAQGVTLKTEPDGRMFPVTDRSQTIMDALLQGLGPTRIHTGQRVMGVAPSPAGGWQVTCLGTRTDQGQTHYQAKTVVFTTGGSPLVWRMLAALGQPITPAVPSLFTFTLDAPWLTALAGVSVPDVRLSLPNAAPNNAPANHVALDHVNVLPQTGPLLVTHWGISGPVTLRLSAFAARTLAACHYNTTVHVDWLPTLTWEACRDALLAYKQTHPTRQPAAHPVFPLPRQLWKALVESVTPVQWAQLSKAQLHQVVTRLKQCALPMTGKGVFKEEFVQAGGVRLDGVHPKTLESKTLPGVYFAGEVLDVDGVTGGFNFQNAWTTAYTVAKALRDAYPESG
jgi:predicted Rossmann fold flavoprotein